MAHEVWLMEDRSYIGKKKNLIEIVLIKKAGVQRKRELMETSKLFIYFFCEKLCFSAEKRFKLLHSCHVSGLLSILSRVLFANWNWMTGYAGMLDENLTA